LQNNLASENAASSAGKSQLTLKQVQKITVLKNLMKQMIQVLILSSGAPHHSITHDVIFFQISTSFVVHQEFLFRFFLKLKKNLLILNLYTFQKDGSR
jgi:hypothetical protein